MIPKTVLARLLRMKMLYLPKLVPSGRERRRRCWAPFSCMHSSLSLHRLPLCALLPLCMRFIAFSDSDTCDCMRM